MRNRILLPVLGFILLAGCGKKEGELFRMASERETGIDFVNAVEETEELNILDYLYFYDGGGVAVGDINGDGLPDIYLAGNQVKNKLYLNKGGLQFEDITEKAGVGGNSSWNTGAVMGDLNGDGLLDIYVCAVVGLKGFNGHNELFINNGDLTFTERSREYGLDFESYSSTTAFLDYDLDGDLDLYLLNHAVHTQESFGKADLRNKRNYQTGDKLLRNDRGVFTDVSEEAGIFGGVNGYGLSVAVADFNRDGYPDLYVSNDFHEDDYYYLNNGDGTFSERLKEFFGHVTRFSMGNDAADINHDGLPDLISLDMLPEDEVVLKSSDGDESLQILNLRVKQYGYHYQFTRNMLQINQPNGKFMETALLSGVAATDWSWSPLFADFNQDGNQDLFVSNGIPKRPNNMDYIKFVSDEQIRKKINNTKLVDQQALEMMPSGKVHNYIFEGTDGIIFKDRSGSWIVKDSLISGASALADLDQDGDLDLVVNNIDQPASIYVNKTDTKANYLKLRFDYPGMNTSGIGTKVYSYHQGIFQFKELYTVRGFQSSSEPIVHFGYGKATRLDSLRILWPDGTSQLLKDIELNQSLVIRPENTMPYKPVATNERETKLFSKVKGNLGIEFTHVEDNYLDFNYQKLIPYKVSDRGPATAVGDLNGDGAADVFIGGSKLKAEAFFLQKDTAFVKTTLEAVRNDSIKEVVSALIADLDNDGLNDLYLAAGGADFYSRDPWIRDGYYKQEAYSLVPYALPDFFGNASVVKAADYDGDGDLDLFIGNHVVSNDFGKLPACYLLENENGNLTLTDNPVLKQIGMVTDAVWDDFDSDGQVDLLVVGEWMRPRFFRNDKGTLIEVKMLNESLNGLWQRIEPFDIDGDGDTDYLLGNWGVNTKFKASSKFPMKMYYHDFDNNGRSETVIATEKKGSYYPLLGLDELASQMVQLRKKYPSYGEFAGKSMEEVIGKQALDSATLFTVSELRSGYLKNEGGKFSFEAFPTLLQVAPITAFLSYDFDGDQRMEVLAAGNYFGVKPFHGRFDSFPGALIKGPGEIEMGSSLGLDLMGHSARQLNIIELQGKPYLLVTMNDDAVQVYKLNRY